MKSVALLSHKGGTGKTTVSLHLGVAAALAQYVTAVIDLDPQASATEWGDSRDAEIPAVVSAQASRLGQVMQTAEAQGVEIVFIDTAPLSETTALAVARAADLILVPCRPAILDLRAIKATRDLVKLANRPAVVVLNAVPPARHAGPGNAGGGSAARIGNRARALGAAKRLYEGAQRGTDRARSGAPGKGGAGSRGPV